MVLRGGKKETEVGTSPVPEVTASWGRRKRGKRENSNFEQKLQDFLLPEDLERGNLISKEDYILHIGDLWPLLLFCVTLVRSHRILRLKKKSSSGHLKSLSNAHWGQPLVNIRAHGSGRVDKKAGESLLREFSQEASHSWTHPPEKNKGAP